MLKIVLFEFGSA